MRRIKIAAHDLSPWVALGQRKKWGYGGIAPVLHFVFCILHSAFSHGDSRSVGPYFKMVSSTIS